MFRRLGGATVNYGLGSVLPQVVSFLLVPVFTAFLDPEDFGLLELAAALGSLVVIAMRLGLGGAITRFFFDHRDGDALRDYVTTVGWFVMVGSLAVGAATLAAMPFIGFWVAPGLDYFPFVVLVVLSSLFAGPSEIQRRLVQAREQSSYSMRLNFSTALATTILSLAFVAGLGWGPAGMLLAQLASSIAFYFQALHYLRFDLAGRFRRVMLKESLAYAGGILPSSLFGALAPLTTRAILVHFQSLGALGLFGVAGKFVRPQLIAVFAFNSAFLPIYFAERKDGSSEAHARLARVASAVWFLAVAGSLAVAVLAAPAIEVMTPSRFHGATPLVPWLVLGGLAQMLYIVTGAEIFYAKKTWISPVLTAAGLVFTLGLTTALATPLGGLGLAIASGLGLWVNTLIGTLYARHLVKLPFRWGSMVRTLLLGLFFAVGVELSPWQSPGFRLVAGSLACILFPTLLWIIRDPAVAEAVSFLRRKLTRG